MLGLRCVPAACLALLIAGCSAENTAAPADTTAAADTTAVDQSTDVGDIVATEPAPDAQTDGPDETVVAGFDIHAVPISEHPLGAFPFFSIPDGYREVSTNTRTLDFGEALFWTGTDVQRVEGRVYATSIRIDRSQSPDKQFSDLEVVRNLERAVVSAGGVEIFAGETPADRRDEIFAVMKAYRGEPTCYSHSPQQVFVLRRDDGNVWVRTCRGGTHAGLMVLQEEALQVTSSLLPATALEQALADAGRVALQVHFATDRAEILPDSQPQIAAVVELLRADDTLSLSIEGHTDNTGDAARNRTLSQARAASVVAAITDAGIAGDRLASAGHGDTRPVADNTTDDGRAQNRRVELVRRD